MVSEKQTAEKSRRERRKESRLAKNASKHQSWLLHQKSRATKQCGNDSELETKSKSDTSVSPNPKETGTVKLESYSRKHETAEEYTVSEENCVTDAKKIKKMKKGSYKSSRKSMVEMGMQDVSMAAEKDLELERKLSKKLKVKEGKLRGVDDGLNILLEGMFSADDFMGEGEVPGTGELPVKRLKKSLMSKKDKLSKKRIKVAATDDASGDVETCNQDVESDDVPDSVPSRKKHKKRKLSGQQQEDNVEDDAVGMSKSVESCGMEVELGDTPAEVPVKKAKEKYIAPHLRARAGNEPEEHTQIRRQVRGLLNRLSESNVESITGELSLIFQSVARSVASHILTEEILASCSRGPRGNQQYAAVFAAFVAGMACLVGVDFSAKFMASFAKCFEVYNANKSICQCVFYLFPISVLVSSLDHLLPSLQCFKDYKNYNLHIFSAQDEYNKEDNLSLRNLTLLLSYLCIFGVCSSDLIYDFLVMLSKCLTEIDVSIILALLQCCGMKIRADDPAAMKDFILSVQNTSNKLKASSADVNEKKNSKRMEFMLEIICDIKNNKRKPNEDSAHHTRIKKWLQKVPLRVDDILIRGIKWSKLLDPDKKGQWWLSGDVASATDNVEEVANRIDKDVLETQRMLQLAATQKMNTDARRAIFCIIMSGEDYIDAFEKLLRLELPGKQDRDIMRVLVECCLQEKVFNKYYTVLASKLCEHDKNHKFTLQFCLWDKFKEVESMPLMRSMHLAKFVAEMVASFTLSLAVLKPVDLNDITLLTARRIMHFRIMFEAIFEFPENLVWNIFTRAAVTPELESLRQGLEFFIKEYVVKTNKDLTQKFKLAKRALNNMEGVLM
ncbi:Nucleolar MIF4G domain-containing protein 1, partial [Mucuna pruriens]